MAGTNFLKAGDGQILRADAAMAGVILVLGFVLAVTGNSLVERWRSSSARQQSVSFEDQLGITANLAGLAVIIWWALSLAAAFTAALLERGGSARAAAATGRFSPGFMRRLALAAVGLQLITAPLANAAAPAAVSGAGPSPATAASAAWTPAPDRSLAAYTHPAHSLPSTLPPRPPPESAPPADPHWKPLRPVVEPGPLASRPLRPQEQAAPGEVTVRAGDSLWSLSAAQLGAFASDVDIAAAWPRLYQANRQVIGKNPDLLLPGQVLRFPPGT